MSPKPVTRYLVQLHEYAHESGVGRGLAVHEPKIKCLLSWRTFCKAYFRQSTLFFRGPVPESARASLSRKRFADKGTRDFVWILE